MKSTWLTSIGAAALALALAGPATAQDRFSEWDANKDGSVSSDEYNAGVEKVGVFKRYDANSDNMLDDSEFMAAKMNSARYGDMSAFDTNSDKMIDSGEFSSRLYAASRTSGADTTGSTAEGAGLTIEEFGTTQDIFDE